MIAKSVLSCTLAAVPRSPPAPEPTRNRNGWLDQYKPIAQKIIAQSQSSDFAWKRLAELTDTFGNRLSGSETLEQAIDWAVAAMKDDGLENVRKERVMVPKWVRGRESLELVQPVKQSLVDARARRLGRHARRRHRSRRRHRQELRRSRPSRGGRQRQDRALQRAVTRTTGRRARIDRTGRRARPSSARSRCSCARSARRDCARRTPAGSCTPPTRRRFRRRRFRPRTPIVSSGWPIATCPSACGSRWRRTSIPTPSRTTSSASGADASCRTRFSSPAAISTRGTSARARATTAAAASSRGKRCG